MCQQLWLVNHGPKSSVDVPEASTPAYEFNGDEEITYHPPLQMTPHIIDPIIIHSFAFIFLYIYIYNLVPLLLDLGFGF